MPLLGEDFNQVLESMHENGVDYIDLRAIGNKLIVDLSKSEIQNIKRQINDHAIKVCSISPFLFFRLPLTEREDDETYHGSYSEHIVNLYRAIELANEFDTNLIRCFSFETEVLFSPSGYKPLPFDIWEKMIERLGKAVAIAEKAGKILALENCHWCNLGTGLLAAKAIKELDSKSCRLWWDPANSVMAACENPYPYEYNEIKDYIVAIDMKDDIIDNRYNDMSHVAMGDGNKLNWADIFKGLIRDSYQNIIALESCYVPEWGTIHDGTKESFTKVREILTSLQYG